MSLSSRRKYYRLESSLNQFFGKERGSHEILPWLPKPQSLGDLLKPIEDKLPDSELIFKLNSLKPLWSDIVGIRFVKYARPTGFQDHTLLVEVDRQLIMMELNSQKKKILSRIYQLLGNNFCQEIKFLVAGN